MLYLFTFLKLIISKYCSDKKIYLFTSLLFA
nr:MAG TPA: hypothetical protein [Bacteriophage sp.]